MLNLRIIDWQFLKKLLSNYQIYTILIFDIIREINIVQYISSNYVLFNLWLFNNNIDNFIIIHIIQEMYLINKLRVNLLININIQKLKSIIILILKRCFYINNYVEFIIIINIVNVEKLVDRLIRIKKIIILLLFDNQYICLNL